MQRTDASRHRFALAGDARPSLSSAQARQRLTHRPAPTPPVCMRAQSRLLFHPHRDSGVRRQRSSGIGGVNTDAALSMGQLRHRAELLQARARVRPPGREFLRKTRGRQFFGGLLGGADAHGRNLSWWEKARIDETALSVRGEIRKPEPHVIGVLATVSLSARSAPRAIGICRDWWLVWQ